MATRYRKPPIVERIIGVYHPMSSEHFDECLPEWIRIIQSEYPVQKSFPEWEIKVERRNGIPIVQNVVPKAKVVHLYFKKHSKGHEVLGMRLRPDRLVFHLKREDNDPHRFEELFPEMERWLHRWGEHFGVQKLDGVTVEYVNQIDAEITPQFFITKDDLAIADVLTMFANIPGTHQGIIRPFDCRMRVIIDKDVPCFFDYNVHGMDKKHGIQVIFRAETVARNRNLSLDKALNEIQMGHRVMLERFDCFFTEKARESFEPYVDPV